jgi:hypothetical protein
MAVEANHTIVIMAETFIKKVLKSRLYLVEASQCASSHIEPQHFCLRGV